MKKALDEVEAFIEDYPDSALIRINDLDVGAIKKPEDEARYALLKSMTLDKNYIDVCDDSLINIAVTYYEASEDCRYKMLSNYYKGRIKYYALEDEDALYYALEAIRISELLNDTLWIARSNELASDIYLRKTSVKQAKIHSEKAAEFYNKCRKIKNEIYALSDVAWEKHYLGDELGGGRLIDSLINLTRRYEPQDTFLLSYLLAVSLRIEMYKKDYTKSLSIIREIEANSPGASLTDYFYINAANVYFCIDSLSKAESYLNKLDSNPSDNALKLEKLLTNASILRAKGDYKNATSVYYTLIDSLNTEIRSLLNQSLLKVRADYINGQLKKQQMLHEKNERRNINIAICSILILIIFVCVIFL